jgi:hypothetical protein
MRWLISFRFQPPRVTAPTEDEPVKKRRWIAPSLLILSLIAAIGAVLSWRWWDRLANQRYESALADIRAAGFLVAPLDAAREPIDPAENGAVLLVDASKRIVNVDGIDPPRFYSKPLKPDELSYLKRFLATNTTVLEAARRARAMPKLRLDDDAIPAFDRYDQLQQLRRLYGLLECAVTYSHNQSDDCAAIEYLRDMVCLAKAEESSITMETSHGGVILRWLIANQAAEMSPEIRIGPNARDARREQIVQLIDELEDPSRAGANFGGLLMRQRGEILATIERHRDGPIQIYRDNANLGPLLTIVHRLAGPFYRLKEADFCRQSLALQRAVGADPSAVPPKPLLRPPPLSTLRNIFAADEVQLQLENPQFEGLYTGWLMDMRPIYKASEELKKVLKRQ